MNPRYRGKEEMDTNGATGAQWGIRMKQALVVAMMAYGLALCAATKCVAQYLTGSAREDFIRGAVNGCTREKIKD
jgi:hypothetical protein